MKNLNKEAELKVSGGSLGNILLGPEANLGALGIVDEDGSSSEDKLQSHFGTQLYSEDLMEHYGQYVIVKVYHWWRWDDYYVGVLKKFTRMSGVIIRPNEVEIEYNGKTRSISGYEKIWLLV